MAQNTATVTAPNPSYPSNMSSVGALSPNAVPNYTKLTYADLTNWSATNPKVNPPPFYAVGAAGVLQTFATNVAALASGTGATSGGTENTYPGTGNPLSPPTTVNNIGAVPASSSVAHEGSGNEVTVLAPGNINYSYVGGATLDMGRSVSCGPVLTPGTMPQPNQLHASSLSPAYANNPTLTTIAPTTSVHGTAAITMTATGVGFTRQSVIYIGGVRQNTTYVSSTSLTCLATPPAAAGTPAVTVITGGAVTTAPQTWTIT